MKNLFIGITLLIIISCSSNPKNTDGSHLEGLLIQKPQINYKLNSLPKDINVIYFASPKINKEFPQEVQGLLTNYYSFSEKNKYFPKIKFINLNQESSCNFSTGRNSFSIVFLLNTSLDDKTYESCLNRISSLNSLFVVDSSEKQIYKNFRYFNVDRDEDKYRLLDFINPYNKNLIVIDSEITKDKYEIGKYWKDKFNKEVIEYETFNKLESSEKLFSKLLLSEQSDKRKRKLSRIISKDLEHEPRTRKDLDALFLSVSTHDARRLKPALDYSYLEGMEVFLVSDWVEDILFTKFENDLEKVISIDIPFMLPTTLPSELKDLKNRTRDFATGYDSFEIFLIVKGSKNPNKTIYKGLTGKLTFKDKFIERKSKIFKIENGSYKYLN